MVKNTKKKSNKNNKTIKRINSKYTVYVGKIYADWCGHCVSLGKEWKKMKHNIRKLKGGTNTSFVFIEIGDTNINRSNKITIDQLLHNFNTKHLFNKTPVTYNGYPTIFKVHGSTIEYYDGPRTSDKMYKWFTKI